MNRNHLQLAIASIFAAGSALAQHGEEHVPAASNTAAAAAHGAEVGAHGAAAGHHAPHIANWWGIGEQYADTPALGWLTITFLIFVGILVFFGRPAITRYLQTRADVVEKAIAEARRAKEDAERRARDAEQKLAALAGEIDKLKSGFAAQGKLESDRIALAAEAAAQKIGRDAEDTIAAETERAREALRLEASKLALQLAEERIKQMLSVADDDKLKTSLIQGLSA